MQCPLCGWHGIFDDTEPDADGEGSPGCPVIDCGGIVFATNLTND